jgi:hypothetical protein
MPASIAANAPLAVQAAKELALRSSNDDLATGLRLEQFVNHILRQTETRWKGRAPSPKSARQPRERGAMRLRGRYVIAGIGHTAFGKLPGATPCR